MSPHASKPVLSFNFEVDIVLIINEGDCLVEGIANHIQVRECCCSKFNRGFGGVAGHDGVICGRYEYGFGFAHWVEFRFSRGCFASGGFGYQSHLVLEMVFVLVDDDEDGEERPLYLCRVMGCLLHVSYADSRSERFAFSHYIPVLFCTGKVHVVRT